MNNNVLAINGQRLTLHASGGAGRYFEQLYKKIIDPINAEDFSGLDVHFLGIRENNHSGLTVAQQKKQSAALVKQIVNRCCPPFIFDRLCNLYQYTTRNSRLENKPDKSDVSICSSFFPSSSLMLLHEITNYGVLEEIGRLSRYPSLRLLVSFLDIQDYYYPEYFKDNILTSRRLAYSFYKDRADFFFAISEFTKQSMVDRLNISPEKIQVTHLAADDMKIIHLSKEVEQWAASYGRFWIYPAKAWKHKNHDFLMRSVGKCKDKLKCSGVKILLTGGFKDSDLRYLNKLINENSLHEVVEILGFVSDEQLQALLKKADFLVFPSLFEGFGMPILEAMTLGCPVLSSNACSLPEIGGDAAMYFDPKKIDDFISLINSALTYTGIDRDAMIKKGYKNCQRFSWAKTYRDTKNVYKKVLS